MTFQVGLYSDTDLAPSCRARGPHVCIRYPATRSGPEQVEVPILDGTRIPVQGRSSLPDNAHPATSGAPRAVQAGTPWVPPAAGSALRGSPVADLPPESASAG